MRHWDTWAEPGVRSRIFTFPMVDGRPQGARHQRRAGPERRFAVQAVRRRRGARLQPRRPHPLFHAARGRARRAHFDQPRHLRGPGRRQRRADQPHRRQSRAWTPARAVSPDGRWLAYTAMARPTYEADRQVVQLRDLRTGATRALTAGLGPFGRLDRLGAGRPLACWSPPATRSTRRSSASTSASGRVTRLTQAGTAGNVVPLRDGAHPLHAEQPAGARRPLPARRAAAPPPSSPGSMPTSSPGSIRSTSSASASPARMATRSGARSSSRRGSRRGRLPTLLLIHGGPQS